MRQVIAVLFVGLIVTGLGLSSNKSGQPAPTPSTNAEPPITENPLRNLYFGDLHVHTSRSFDAKLFGNRIDIEGAYRFARGEPIDLHTGERASISRPLDFVAITDHAESFGVSFDCDSPDITEARQKICADFKSPSLDLFNHIRRAALDRPITREKMAMCPQGEADGCIARAQNEWSQMQAITDRFNDPGNFTAFQAYEYSPALPGGGKIHRNVIFKTSDTPALAFSSFDAATVIDLWRLLDQHCTGACDVLTIPHNMNKTWGLAYARKSLVDTPYQTEDWALRARSEPLAEIYQIKGASECALALGATDEECAFEQVFTECDEGQEHNCAFNGSFARDGLKLGLSLEEELHFNPLRFGFIGSTDTHNSNPGDVEENDYRGGMGIVDSPTNKRLKPRKPSMGSPSSLYHYGPGGLAAVWATSNSRAAIFDAMARRETYATSGPRIRLRFFAGHFDGTELPAHNDPISVADRHGVPMGGVLESDGQAPQFFVWAEQDPLGLPLTKIQIVKGWMENGTATEMVIDIACASGTPTAGKCTPLNAPVDLATCAPSSNVGAATLKTVWHDPDFHPEQSAFYYVRVLQIPSCRWSSWDAIRSDLPLPADLPKTIQERAWSSPIWIKSRR